MTRLAVILLALAALLTGPLALAALADGVYIPAETAQKLPDMPRQRAIVRFKDGEEKLTVESSLDAEGQSFGWILPVPAEPTAIEKTTPGLLDTFESNLGPEVRHKRHPREVTREMAMFIAVLLWVLVLIMFDRMQRWVLIAILLPMMFFGYACPSYISPRGQSAGMTSYAGVRELARRHVGSYEVTVLKADDASKLDEWLNANGFRKMPDGAGPKVNRYIDEGWVFVASKLTREGDGLSSPHPLCVTFPAEKPVYPMRLTELSGSKLFLQLYVIGDGSAKTGRMKQVFTDSFRLAYKKPYPDYLYDHEDLMLKRDKAWVSRLDVAFGHPKSFEELWDRCSVTQLQGEFRQGGEWDDLTLEIGAAESRRAEIYSEVWASETATLAFYRLCYAGIPLVMFALWGWISSSNVPGARKLLVAVAIIICSLGCSWSVRQAIPVSEIQTIRHGWDTRYGEPYIGSGTQFEADMLEWAGGVEDFGEMSAGEAQAALIEFMREDPGELGWKYRLGLDNIGDSPRDWQIVEGADGKVFRYYTGSGAYLQEIELEPSED